MLKASLILVNFESEDLAIETLQQVHERADSPAQTIVVDNSPGTALKDAVAHLGSTATYRPTARNLGFGGGVNVGLESASHDSVLVLNPDARPEPGCLTGLVELLECQPSLGIAGPALLPIEPNDSLMPSATRTEPGLRSTLLEHTILRRLSAEWLDEHYFLSPRNCTEATECAMVQGACFALRRQVAEQVGGFDERFFHSWEETDLCRRAREAGWRILYCPYLRCRHQGGGSTPDASMARDHFWQGLFAYHRKHNGRLHSALLRTLLVPGVAAESAVLECLGFVRPRDLHLARDRQECRERLMALLRFRPAARPSS